MAECSVWTSWNMIKMNHGANDTSIMFQYNFVPSFASITAHYYRCIQHCAHSPIDMQTEIDSS
jgi:hypothetical protein